MQSLRFLVMLIPLMVLALSPSSFAQLKSGALGGGGPEADSTIRGYVIEIIAGNYQHGYIIKANVAGADSGFVFAVDAGAGLSYFTEADVGDTSQFTATAPNTVFGINDPLTMMGNNIINVNVISSVDQIIMSGTRNLSADGALSITTASGDLTLNPGGTFIQMTDRLVANSGIETRGGSTVSGRVLFYEDTDDGGNYVNLIGPALSSNITLTLPVDDGEAGELLSTDGSGVMSWIGTIDTALALAPAAGDATKMWIDANDTLRIVMDGENGAGDTVKMFHRNAVVSGAGYWETLNDEGWTVVNDTSILWFSPGTANDFEIMLMTDTTIYRSINEIMMMGDDRLVVGPGGSGSIVVDTIFGGDAPVSQAVANISTTKPGYIFQEPDIHVGNAAAGMIEIGDAIIAVGTRDTLYNNDSLDIGGTMIFRQTVAPDGLFEFAFYENGGDLRLVIPKSGDSLGMWSPRSVFIAGPERMIDSVVRFDFWGFTKIDANTDATGADLGVQDDLEVMGKVYLDTIDNITAAPIEILADLDLNSNDMIAIDSADIVAYTDGSLDPPDLADADFGDWTVSSGSATLDDDVVAPAEMADADHGDVNWTSGVASVEGGFSDSTGAAIASDIIMDTLGAPTFSTVQHLQNIFHSAGWVSGGAFTDTTDGAGDVDSLYVAAGTGLIRASDLAADTNAILFFDWGDTTIAIPADTTLFVGVEYNGGSPRVFQTTADKSLLDHQQNFELGTVTNETGLLHLTFNPHSVGDHATAMIERTQGTMGIQRDNDLGGLILGETGTRNPTVTAGTLFSKLNAFAISAIDLSVSGSMDRYYRDAGTGFTKQAAVTTWNNTQWDDGDGGLATLNNNRYAMQWFYLELDGALVSMFGRNEYVSLAGAEAEAPPSTLPLRLSVNQAKLIGRIIFQESDATASEIQTVFTTVFPATAASDHGNLAGLSDDDHTQYVKESDYEYVSFTVVYGRGPGVTDSVTLGLPRYNSGLVLAHDSTNQGSDQDTVYIAGTIPFTATAADSIIFCYRGDGGAVIDSLRLFGPDLSNGLNRADSVWYEADVNLTSSSWTRVAYYINESSGLAAGQNFALEFLNILATDEDWVQIAWVQIRCRR